MVVTMTSLGAGDVAGSHQLGHFKAKCWEGCDEAGARKLGMAD